MQIFVRSFDSKTLCLNVKGTQPVSTLKGLVAERTGVPTTEQRLLYAGRHLTEGASIDDNGIRENCTVQLLLRLYGGAFGVFVKVLGGKSIRLEVSGNETTIAQIQIQLREQEGLEAEKYELMYCGQRLDSAKPLLHYQIAADATLDAVLPMSRPKGRCAVNDCVERIAKVVGECRYCGLGHCSRHRLPESHACDNLQGCRQQSYEKNSSKLMGEKCVADKF